MQSLIEATTGLPDAVRLGLPLAFLGFGILIERTFPLLRIDQPWSHVGTILLMLVGVATTSMMVGLVTLGLLITDAWHFGLLYLVDLPLWLEITIALLALDFFTQYFAHVILHRYKWLWKMHVVHHSDLHVDASTGTRLHSGDFLLREVIAWSVVAALGIPVAVYAFYRLITPFFSYLTHANVLIPEHVDRFLNLVFVTPNMHKVHHHDERPWTNCNYGNLLSVWDRLFGTLARAEPREIKYGLDVLRGRSDATAAELYVMPFDRSLPTDY